MAAWWRSGPLNGGTSASTSRSSRSTSCPARSGQLSRRRSPIWGGSWPPPPRSSSRGGRMAIVASDVRISILGPLEVRVGFGDPVDVVGPRLRRLLVRLAVDPDRVVLTGQLVDGVWGEDPPAGLTNALQSLVSRLRRLLPDVVESHPSGYRLALEPDAVDVVRFRSLALAGRDELRSDPRQAGATLRERLALWRGPALADAADAHFAQAAAARLDELGIGALEDRIEADLATTADGALVAELEELVTAHPLRERLCGQLMRALARTGRQAEALAAYERLRTRLADELGIDPSEELKAVHLDVLRGEVALPQALLSLLGARELGLLPPRGSARSPRGRSPPAWTTASGCWPTVAGRSCRGTRRCGPWST